MIRVDFFVLSVNAVFFWVLWFGFITLVFGDTEGFLTFVCFDGVIGCWMGFKRLIYVDEMVFGCCSIYCSLSYWLD